MGEKSYANAWLALLPQAHLPGVAAQAVARECARYADWATGQNVRPTRKRLAWNLNTSEATVKRGVQVCVSHGVLKVVAKGGVRGPRQVAAVYCLSVPEHLATPENLATFPRPEDVVIVRPQAQGEPVDPALDPDLEDPADAPAGHGRPAGNPPSVAASGSPVTHPAGHGRPVQRVTDDPPPSIDPPGDPSKVPHTAPRGSLNAPPVSPRADASRRAAADADGTQQRRTNADGIRAVRAALRQAAQSPGVP